MGKGGRRSTKEKRNKNTGKNETAEPNKKADSKPDNECFLCPGPPL
jgi:hypothetical protein